MKYKNGVHKKTLTALVLLFLFTYSFTVSASASASADKIGDYVLNGGVGNWGYSTRNFYITSSASGYESVIQDAMDSWIYTTSRLGVSTSISWSRTYTQSSSYMDFYYGQYYSSDFLAVTTFWLYQTQIYPSTQNWGWGKIQLNPSSTTTGGFNNLSAYNKQGTAAHEIGHVFGLADTNTITSSIMCQLGYGRAVNEPQVCDLIPIQEMYP